MRGNRGIRIRLKDISVDEIKELVKLVESELEKKDKNRRGRPKKYSDTFILTILFLKTIYNYSFRETTCWVRQIEKFSPAINFCITDFHKYPKEF